MPPCRPRSTSPAPAAARPKPARPRTTQSGNFSRAQGASSGAESYVLSYVLVIAIMYPREGWTGVLKVMGASLLLQLLLIHRTDRQIMWTYCTSQKLGPNSMRNGSIGFAECVRPGGKPTNDHCLALYNYPPLATSIMFTIALVLVLPLNPVTAIIRSLYPEHIWGVNRGRVFGLWWLFVRHPMAVQGEGPSNGDGLAAMNAAESLIYPAHSRLLDQGPTDRAYWVEEGQPPRWRDMFHDKVFCHRFFEEHGVAHPVLVAVCDRNDIEELHVDPADAPKKLIWKPRYSTMSLGVEHFTGWVSDGEGGQTTSDAPSDDPYVVEEFLQSSEHSTAEWYRMPTVWDYDEDKPKMSYIWRTRNGKQDVRVQTDIIGGAYCVPGQGPTPFIGPGQPGFVVDPRAHHGTLAQRTTPLDPLVDKALQKAAAQGVMMHEVLGKEIWSIGWDVMVRDGVPYFIEFNVNNGFYVADHTLEEVHQMTDFYGRNFRARIREQLTDFDPIEADRKFDRDMEKRRKKQ